MADQMKPTPRSTILGLFSDLVNLPLQYMSAPERTQQMQGTAQFLYGTGIPQTLERASYGDSLFTGSGMTLRPREETINAAMTVAPFVKPAAVMAGRTGRAVGRMAGEEINAAMTGQPTRTILGQITPQPKSIVPVDVARQIDIPVNLPTSQEFITAIKNEPSAQITDEGLLLNLVRRQSPDQSGAESVRTGVFYLPEGQSANLKNYKGKTGYGGVEPIEGQTLYKNPLFVKGATGGKAPEVAYDLLAGKGAYEAMRNDVLKSYNYNSNQSQKVEAIQGILEKYNGLDSDDAYNMAYNIVINSKAGNTLPYAVQENIVGNAVRNAGHDAVLGYSKGRGDKGEFLSEVFDVRELTYPTPQGGYQLMPQFENLLTKESDPFGNTIGSSIR
jgi:hypothetical protein